MLLPWELAVELLIAAKQTWNEVVYTGYQARLPLATTELQVTARLTD